MRTWFAAWLALTLSAFAPQAIGDVIIDNDLNVIVEVAVSNASAEPVTFFLTGSNCRTVAPGFFVVAANSTSNISITWDYHDHDGDSCYTAHHYTEYTDAADLNTKFRIQQSNSDNRSFCLDIKYYLFFWINQAVCPDVMGNVITAQDGGGSVSCPPGVPSCPPYDDGESTLYFGVLYAKAGAGGAAATQSIPTLSMLGLLILVLAALLIGAARIRKSR